MHELGLFHNLHNKSDKCTITILQTIPHILHQVHKPIIPEVRFWALATGGSSRCDLPFGDLVADRDDVADALRLICGRKAS